jgi:hypothetical protein
MSGKGSKGPKSAGSGSGAGKGDDGGGGGSSKNTTGWHGVYTKPAKTLEKHEIESIIKTLSCEYGLHNLRGWKHNAPAVDLYKNLIEFFWLIQQDLSIDISFLNELRGLSDKQKRAHIRAFIENLDREILGREIGENIDKSATMASLVSKITTNYTPTRGTGSSHTKNTGFIQLPNHSVVRGNATGQAGHIIAVSSSHASGQKQGKTKAAEGNVKSLKARYKKLWEDRQILYRRTREAYANAILDFWKKNHPGGGGSSCSSSYAGEEESRSAAASSSSSSSSTSGAAAASSSSSSSSSSSGAAAAKSHSEENKNKKKKKKGGSLTRKNIARRRRNTRKL